MVPLEADASTEQTVFSAGNNEFVTIACVCADFFQRVHSLAAILRRQCDP
jgi:hypothetical protein